MKNRIFSIFFAFCMMATMLPMSAMAASTATAFIDVPSNHWAYDAINEMVDGGITNGYKDGTFHPDKLVNNAQFVTMVLRCFRGMLIRGEFGDDVTSV